MILKLLSLPFVANNAKNNMTHFQSPTALTYDPLSLPRYVALPRDTYTVEETVFTGVHIEIHVRKIPRGQGLLVGALPRTLSLERIAEAICQGEPRRPLYGYGPLVYVADQEVLDAVIARLPKGKKVGHVARALQHRRWTFQILSRQTCSLL